MNLLRVLFIVSGVRTAPLFVDSLFIETAVRTALSFLEILQFRQWQIWNREELKYVILKSILFVDCLPPHCSTDSHPGHLHISVFTGFYKFKGVFEISKEFQFHRSFYGSNFTCFSAKMLAFLLSQIFTGGQFFPTKSANLSLISKQRYALQEFSIVNDSRWILIFTFRRFLMPLIHLKLHAEK